MMQERFICKSVKKNNGIRQVHLTGDVYLNEGSQPTEILLNTRSDMFREGDEWFVQMTRVARKRREPFPHTGQ